MRNIKSQYTETTKKKGAQQNGMLTRNNIRARLVALGKKNTDMIAALREYGVTTDRAEFSAAINRHIHYPKCDLICDTADKILTEWEKK